MKTGIQYKPVYRPALCYCFLFFSLNGDKIYYYYCFLFLILCCCPARLNGYTVFFLSLLLQTEEHVVEYSLQITTSSIVLNKNPQ